MALGAMITPFMWGAGGERLTPEQVAQQRRVLDALAGKTDTSPVGHWSAGLARVVDAFGDKMDERRVNQAETANRESNAAHQSTLSSILSNMYGGSPATGGYAGGDPVAAALTGGAPSASAPMAAPAAVDPATARVSSAHTSGLPSSFLSAVDRTEGAGGYDTLYGHAQRGPFAGTDISAMPIRDVLAFSDPSGAYAQHVKGQIGRVATPMGRHQIVGTTLRRAVAEMGLDPNQPFDAGTQDAVAAHLARSRLASQNTMQGKISALRSEWHGFNNVPDAQMVQIINDLESSPTNAVAANEAMASGVIGGPPSAPPDPNIAPEWATNPNMGGVPPVQALGVGETMPTPSVEQALMGQPQAQQPVQTAQAGGIDPRIIAAMTDPYADENTRRMGQLLFEQSIAQQQEAAERARAEQEAALQMQQRIGAAQAAGVDPRFIGDDTIWQQAAQAQFRDDRTGDIREFEYGQGNPEFYSHAERMARARATNVTTNVGSDQITPGQKKIDEAFAETYLDWNAGGFADSFKQIEQLGEALAILESGEGVTGAIGALPAQVAPFINPNGTIAKENVEEVVQRSLREILGAQFTEKEGERLIARAFNPLMGPQENAKRVRRLMTTIGSMADAKQDMVDYFDEHGTLQGYKGSRPTPSQIERLASEFGKSPTEGASGRVEMDGYVIEEVE